MTEIETLFNEQTIAMIATVLISLFGVYSQKIKSKLATIKDLTIDINDALYDDKITADEVKKISDKLRKLANA